MHEQLNEIFYDFENELPEVFSTVGSEIDSTWLFHREGKLNIKGRDKLASQGELSVILKKLDHPNCEVTIGFDIVEGSSGRAGLIFYSNSQHYIFLNVILSGEKGKLSIQYAHGERVIEHLEPGVVVENDEVILRGHLMNGNLQFSYGSWTKDMEELGPLLDAAFLSGENEVRIGVHCEQEAILTLDFMDCKSL